MLNINEIQLKINDSFIFRRFEKIDWKQIASLNMEQLKASSDWNIIEKNLCNILCCHLESEFNQSNLDPNLCKLFQLAQISIDYLLQIRQQILHELKTCQDQVEANKTTLKEAIKAKEHAEKKLKDFKKEGKKSSNHQQNYYRCPACPKTFLNGDFLHGHWQRRHPEYVTIIPPTTVSSPVRQSPPLPPVIDSPSVNEMSELKTRLQSAEKQLQNEQQFLHSILEKMDKSSINLQGMLSQEVEKIRTALREEKIESRPEIPATTPQKMQSSISVQTTPRMFEDLSTSLPPPDGNGTSQPIAEVSNIDGIEPALPTPSIRSVYSKAQSVKVICTPKEPESPNLENSSSSSDDERPVIQKKKENKVNRQLLIDRFKITIENALMQRMRMLGIDTEKKTMSSGMFRQLSAKLESNQSAEFLETRKHFENQLKDRLNLKNKPLSESLKTASKKLLLSRKEISRSIHRPSPIKMSVVTPPRAPVPTPRSSKNQSTPLSLMARDGEASSVVSISHQEEPPTIPDTVKPNDSPEEDSFSLSSLDAILTELKKPNRFAQPSASKSVQWRVPVETIERNSIEESWDS